MTTASSPKDYLPADEYYGDDFVADQVKKYKEKDRNHWKQRMGRVVDVLREEAAPRVLDLACGIGAFTIDLTKLGYDVVGVDYSAATIRAARKLAVEFGVPETRFLLGDATQMSFADGTFDAIVAADIVEHLFDPPLQRMFDECFRVLKPGGRLIIHTTPTRYHYLFSPLRVFPLLPFAWLPQRPLDRLIELYERYPFSAAYRMVHGETWVKRTAKRGHCNCPDYYRLDKMLETSGFRLERYEADHAPEDFAVRGYALLARAFRNSQHARGHIWALCRKP